ncbi:MAG: glutathione S-transferase family protein [Kofleriaceae bacterium]
MITLYDNALSPFARKVRLALELKQLEYRVLDGLALSNREALYAINPRGEVPAIDHEGVVVINSADIIAYLERRWPSRPLYPDLNAAWIHARAWERCADTLVDAILVNLSYWSWMRREDQMPEGLREAAGRDLELVYLALERDLAHRDFLSDRRPSVADVALFPHLTATRMFGVGHDPERHPRVHAWLKRLRGIGAFADDLERAKRAAATLSVSSDYERQKIFWRGDRIEWVLARGFHGWFAKEIEAKRTLWPGPNVPGPRYEPHG